MELEATSREAGWKRACSFRCRGIGAISAFHLLSTLSSTDQVTSEQASPNTPRSSKYLEASGSLEWAKHILTNNPRLRRIMSCLYRFKQSIYASFSNPTKLGAEFQVRIESGRAWCYESQPIRLQVPLAALHGDSHTAQTWDDADAQPKQRTVGLSLVACQWRSDLSLPVVVLVSLLRPVCIPPPNNVSTPS